MKKKHYFIFLILSLIALIIFVILLNFQSKVETENKSTNQSENDFKTLLVNKTEDDSTQITPYNAKEYMNLLEKIFADKNDPEIFQRDGVSFKVRVIDQFGDPVIGARFSVLYQKGFNSQHFTQDSKLIFTDENGIFNVSINSKVSGIWIAAQKIGYYQIKDKSDKTISMITAQRLTQNLNKDENDRWEKIQKEIGVSYNTLEKLLDTQGVVTLTLKKMSDYDKMYQNMFSFSSTSNDPDEKIPGKYLMEYEKNKSDGIIPEDAHVIDIGPGFYDKSKEQKLKIRYTHNNQYVEMMAAPWYCEMSIPGGGFYLIDEKIEPDGETYQSLYAAEAKEGEEFLAPENGYVETVRAEMPETTLKDGSWRDYYIRNYYVKFPDNTYGRIRVSLGYGKYYQITSWYNPTGRRNTEFCLDDDLDVKYIEKKQ